MNASSRVRKLWNYCNVLRDDGMSHGNYVEPLIGQCGTGDSLVGVGGRT